MLLCISLQCAVEKMVSRIILVAVPPFIRVEPVIPSGCGVVRVCVFRRGGGTAGASIAISNFKIETVSHLHQLMG